MWIKLDKAGMVKFTRYVFYRDPFISVFRCVNPTLLGYALAIQAPDDAVQYFARKLLRHFAGLTQQDIDNEAKTMDKLCRSSHNNIVEIYKHGFLEASAFYFIDVEFCDTNLEEYIQCQKRAVHGLMDWDTAIKMGHGEFIICAIMQQIIGGLKYIHDQGLVHRDLNPQNGQANLN